MRRETKGNLIGKNLQLEARPKVSRLLSGNMLLFFSIKLQFDEIYKNSRKIKSYIAGIEGVKDKSMSSWKVICSGRPDLRYAVFYGIFKDHISLY